MPTLDHARYICGELLGRGAQGVVVRVVDRERGAEPIERSGQGLRRPVVSLRLQRSERCLRVGDGLVGLGKLGAREMGYHSDLDLVIVTQTEQPFFQRLKEVALLCAPDAGVDFLVYTPAEFAGMIAERNPFLLDEVLAKGKVLYGRQPATAMA